MLKEDEDSLLCWQDWSILLVGVTAKEECWCPHLLDWECRASLGLACRWDLEFLTISATLQRSKLPAVSCFLNEASDGRLLSCMWQVWHV